jgi:hypothetical protein
MPSVHRDTDLRNCSAKTTVVGNSTVFVNNLLCAVKDDPNTHIRGELLADVNPGTIFVEGKLMVLVGSNAKPDLLHVNPKAVQGSSDVHAGGGGGAPAGPAGATGGEGAAGGGGEGEGEGTGEDEEDPPVDEEPGDEEPGDEDPGDEPTPEPEPEPEPTTPPGEVSPDVQPRIDQVARSDSEAARIESAIAQANADTGLEWVPVRDQQTGEVFLTTNDFVRGPDGNYIRASGDIARQIAADNGSQLPTRASQIDSIHAAANIRNPMVPAGVPGQVSSSELISRSNRTLDGFGINPGPGDLASGHFKVVGQGGEIYHGIRPGSSTDTWQRSFSRQHSQSYFDYSQGVRLIRPVN